MNRIRELRKRNKMTQKELAKHLRIADSTLSYWEMEKYEPDNESLKKLSRFFHVTIDYILCVDITEREISKDKAIYNNSNNTFSADTTASISETEKIYNSNSVDMDSIDCIQSDNQLNESGNSSASGQKESSPAFNTSNEFISSPASFQRSEFEGLSLNEIDQLAEYAEFIKMKRQKELKEQRERKGHKIQNSKSDD